MKCDCGVEECKGSEEESLDFIRYNWQQFKECVFWDNLIFSIATLIILCIIFGWWGILWGWLLLWIFTSSGGNHIDLNEYPPKEEPKTKCIAGNIDCEICDKDGNLL